jgi:hypothetical protein
MNKAFAWDKIRRMVNLKRNFRRFRVPLRSIKEGHEISYILND